MIKNIFKTDLRFDWKITTITIVSTLVMMLDYYHQFIPGWKGIDRTILYFVVPMVVILLVFRENPKEYGFQLGDWKAGSIITIGALVVILPMLWLVVHGDPGMKKYYENLPSIPLPLYTFLEIFGWEFIFRGWLTFGYARKFGADALWIQAVPFALMHLSKPEVETLSTIFGGFVFGWVAWQTKSFLYPFLIHWAIFTFVVLTARGAFG